MLLKRSTRFAWRVNHLRRWRWHRETLWQEWRRNWIPGNTKRYRCARELRNSILNIYTRWNRRKKAHLRNRILPWRWHSDLAHGQRKSVRRRLKVIERLILLGSVDICLEQRKNFRSVGVIRVFGRVGITMQQIQKNIFVSFSAFSVRH